MTIQKMLESLEELQDEFGAQSEIRVAYQRNYPLVGIPCNFHGPIIDDMDKDLEDAEAEMSPPSEPVENPDEAGEGVVCWLALSEPGLDTPPYASPVAWEQ